MGAWKQSIVEIELALEQKREIDSMSHLKGSSLYSPNPFDR
jgi:hypothetical protein